MPPWNASAAELVSHKRRSFIDLNYTIQGKLHMLRGSYRSYTKDREGTSSDALSSNIAKKGTSNDKTSTSEKLRRVLRKVPFPVAVVSTAAPNDPSVRRGITVSSFSSISLQPIPLIAFCVKLPSRASTMLHESNQFIVQFLASDQITHSVAFSSSVPPPSEVITNLPTSNLTDAASSIVPKQSESRAQAFTRSTQARVPHDKDIEELTAEATIQILADNEIGNSSLADAFTGSQNAKKNGTLHGIPAPPLVTSPSTPPDPDPFEVLGYKIDPESNLPVLLNTLGAIRCSTHQVMAVGDHEMWIGHVEKVLHGEIPDQQEPLLYHDRSYRRVGRRIV
ncbi:hypothetical protein BX616_010209 [Lobosporangium transversale]|nr:hypothetical protein BX616_010209 [Lobosporangium transversale]